MHTAEYRETALRDIQTDPRYLSWTQATEQERVSLLESMRRFGLLSPLLVMEMGDGTYQILDGHRRYAAARELGWRTIGCLIYPKMSNTDVVTLRFQLHELTKPWTQAEHQFQKERMPK